MEKDKKIMELKDGFNELYEKFKNIQHYKKEIYSIDNQIYQCDNLLKNNIDIIIQVLKKKIILMMKI